MPETLNRSDFSLLVILNAVLQERSVSRAAVRMNLSQPAISHAMHRLRRLVGDDLLVRVGQRYELTAAAQALVEPLRITLKQLDELICQRPTFDPQSAAREFKILASDYTAAILFRPAIRKLAATAPNLRIFISPSVNDPVGALRSGEYDLAFYPANVRPDASDLSYETAFRDTWCCATWSGNRAIGDSLSLEAFEALPHIVEYFTDLPDHDFIRRVFPSATGRRKPLAGTNYILLIPFLLQGTSTLAVVPRRLADWLREAADLRVLDLPFEAPDFVQEMCWSSRYTTDPAHLWLRRFLREMALGDAG